MEIVILGAGGFIGSHLVEHLLTHTKHRVVGVDRDASKLDGIGGGLFEFHLIDLAENDHALESMVQRADIVIDLVAYANPSIYVEDPLEVFEVNFAKNLRVVRMCSKHGVRLIQVSTSEVYGAPTGDFYDEELSPLLLGPVQKQRWIYASSKQLLERVIHAYGLRGELSYTIVRPFNVIGPRLDYLVPAGTKGGPRVFSHYMSALLTGGPMYLVNGGTVRRCFSHVADAVSALRSLIEHPGAANGIFNLGNPANETTIHGLALLMMELHQELTGRPIDTELVRISGEEFYGAGYEDMDRVPPNIGRLRALGWTPRYDLETTVRDTMAYYLDKEDVDMVVDLEASQFVTPEKRLTEETA